MTKRRHGTPERFERLPVEPRPAAEGEASSAVQRFVATFVIASKRERIASMLLCRQREKRTEAIQTVYKWIEPTRQTELPGNTGFPQRLEKRFGHMAGILIDETNARHVTIAEGAVLAAGRFGAIFIADVESVALLVPEVGPPTLCSKK